MVILTKCHKNWVKIVDFLLIAYFWAGGQFRFYILYLAKKVLNFKKVWSARATTRALTVKGVFEVGYSWYGHIFGGVCIYTYIFFQHELTE